MLAFFLIFMLLITAFSLNLNKKITGKTAADGRKGVEKLVSLKY